MTNFALILEADRSSRNRFSQFQELVERNAEVLLTSFEKCLIQQGNANHDPKPPDPDSIQVWLHHPEDCEEVGLPIADCIEFDGTTWSFGIALYCDRKQEQVVSLLVRCEKSTGPSRPRENVELTMRLGRTSRFEMPHQSPAMATAMVESIIKQINSIVRTPGDNEPIKIGYEKPAKIIECS